MSQSLEQGKRKLTAKDAITAGALGAVCIAIRFVFMLVGGVSPYAPAQPGGRLNGRSENEIRKAIQRPER